MSARRTRPGSARSMPPGAICSMEKAVCLRRGSSTLLNRRPDTLVHLRMAFAICLRSIDECRQLLYKEGLGMSRHLREILPDLGSRTLVMGVLNASPDSFSDRGIHADPDRALDRALAMMDAGADLIDVGGESTRPGADIVDEATELARVLPVIRKLAAAGIGPISIDTTKSQVALRALEQGAAIVNDISAMSFDPEMRRVVAGEQAGVILMHTRGRPQEMQKGELVYEGGVVTAVKRALAEAIATAGVPRELIAIDPGIGFGKTVE